MSYIICEDDMVCRSALRRKCSRLSSHACFIEPQLCQELIRLIDKDRRPSTIADSNGGDYFRTGETCDLDAQGPAVKALFLTQAVRALWRQPQSHPSPLS